MRDRTAQSVSDHEAGIGTAAPWTRSGEDVAAGLHCDAGTGLSMSEAQQRLDRHGPNRLAEGKQTSPLTLLLGQFKNPLLIILMIGAVISLLTGHMVDAIAIAVIVVLNAVISF